MNATLPATMTTPMKLADDVDFELGMTVYLPTPFDIRVIETSREEFEVDSFVFEGLEYHCLGRKGSKGNMSLRCFYSSRAAALTRDIERLEAEIEERKQELARLKAIREMGS